MDSGLAWFVIDRLLEVIFFIDIVLNFNTGYRDHDVVVVDRTLIAQNYIFGWFFIDLLATIPFDLIFEVKTSPLLEPSVFRLSKLPRLLRLLRLFRAHRVFTSVRDSLRFGHALERLTKLIVSAVFVAHWFACIFHFIGVTERARGEENWIVNEGLQDASRSEMYITSVYWAMTTMTTVGAFKTSD